MAKSRSYFGIVALLFLFLSLTLTVGCASRTKTIAPDKELHYDEGYDFSDKKKIVKTLVDSLISKPPLSTRNDRPILIIYGVTNRTDEHISTSGISDDIRMDIIASGKARLLNETQRKNIAAETDYQYGKNVLPETRIARGKQVGAEFMLTGTLRSMKQRQPRQVRLKKKTLQYYSLNLELTSLETGLIEWASNVEIIRESSKPFIGW